MEWLDLKVQIETDADQVDLLNPEIDIHLVTSLVKTYLRDLDAPLLLYPKKERVEYSSISNVDERLRMLSGKIKTLPADKYGVLKALTVHLQK